MNLFFFAKLFFLGAHLPLKTILIIVDIKFTNIRFCLILTRFMFHLITFFLILFTYFLDFPQLQILKSNVNSDTQGKAATDLIERQIGERISDFVVEIDKDIGAKDTFEVKNIHIFLYYLYMYSYV